jgi:hypothetical protein
MCRFSTAAECATGKIAKAVLDLVNDPQIAPHGQLLALLDAALADTTCAAKLDAVKIAENQCSRILRAMRDKLVQRPTVV